MDLTFSNRKRVDNEITVDALYEEPERTEKKNVVEAELEHIGPVESPRNRQSVLKKNKNRSGSKSHSSSPFDASNGHQKEIDRKLTNIQAYEDQITDLVVKIDQERAEIAQLIRMLSG